MKSLNVKKIATAAAGAALLGAAFAGAVQVDSSGLSNFPFFSNGAPNLKIVVGEKAWPSDAVAAANIAAMIGNMAYTSKDITVLGTDLLSCSGGTAATTSSDDKVSLEVTTPGVNPNVAYQMKTYVEGFLDINTTDDRVADVAGAVTILGTASPFTSGGRKMTASESALAFKGTIADSQVSKSYTEEERFYLFAKTQYDSSSKTVKAKNPQVAYEAIFTNPIQVCTEFTPDDSTCSDTYKTTKHRMKIKVLGADWIIVGMDNFDSNTALPGAAVLTLGKEVSYKEFMQIGDKVTAPNGVSAKLKDISAVPTGTAQLLSVSFEVYDANGNVIDTTTLQQDGEYNKNGIVIRVFSVFAGLGQTSYGQVSVFSDKLSLQQASSVSTDNTNWRVNLIGGGTSYGHSLARVQLTRSVSSDLNKGDGLNFLDKPALMKFTFNGLEDVTFDKLSFTTGQQSFQTSATDTTTVDLSYVLVQSSLTSPFDFSDSVTAPTNTNQFYWITDATAAGNGTQGTIFYRDPTTSNFVPYYSTTMTNASASYTTGVTNLAVSTGSGIYIDTTQAPGAQFTNGTQLSSNSSLALTGWTLTRLTAFGSENMTAAVFNMSASAARLTPSGIVVTNLNGNLNVSQSKLFGTNTSNVTLDFVNWNGTITPGQGTTGVSTQMLSNFVKYNYGPNNVYMRFSPAGIIAAATLDTTRRAIFVPEYLKDDDSMLGAFSLGVGQGSTSTPHLAVDSGTATAGYFYASATPNTATYTATATTPDSTYEVGYISPRGSQLSGLSLTSAEIKYATTLAHALTVLATAGTDTGANKATTDYKAGETALEANGYKVVVKAITAKGGTGGTGGSISGVDGLSPSQSTAFVVTPLDTSSSPLVVTDASAGAQPLIVVGGPLVNSVAASALSGAPAPSSSDEPVVKVQGDKILVYGYTASDTTSAANSLIGWLSQNTDSLQGR
ncbi:S-layer protein [Candidatus Micrarchaeota archaeon]|nr:S-layer protein [Candidatus Micrarchaeota archaeon]